MLLSQTLALTKLVDAAKDLGFQVLSKVVKEPHGKPPRITLTLEAGEPMPVLSQIQLDVVSALVHLGSGKDAAIKAVASASGKVADPNNFDMLFRKSFEVVR